MPSCNFKILNEFSRLYYSVRRESGIAIAGDFSTKISNIVEQVLKIRSANADEKILIFSQWQAILFQISKALALNKVQFRSKCIEQDFADFKVSFKHLKRMFFWL